MEYNTTIQKYRIRDQRNRHRLDVLKKFFIDLKEQKKAGNAIIPEKMEKDFQHVIAIVEHI